MEAPGGIGHKEDVEVPFLVHNKDKSLVGFIEKKLNEDIYIEIVEAVRDRGWKSSKAFFYAIMEKSKTGDNNVTKGVKINLSRVLPVESW